MKITKKNLNKLFKINKELETLKEQVSEQLKIAKSNNGDNKIVAKRDDGKSVKLKENEIWEEIYHIGSRATGYKKLRKKYPKLFKLSDKEQKKANEFHSFVYNEFGIDFRKMKFSNLIDAIQSILKYQITKLIPFIVILQIVIAITVYIIMR